MDNVTRFPHPQTVDEVLDKVRSLQADVVVALCYNRTTKQYNIAYQQTMTLSEIAFLKTAFDSFVNSLFHHG